MPPNKKSTTSTSTDLKKPPSPTFAKYMGFVFCLVCALHTFHYIAHGDPLASPYINGEYVSIDSWSIIHLVFFAVVGYHYAGQLWSMMLYGIAWEVFEWLLQNHTRSFWEESHINTAWDIWFNFMGYEIGDFLYSIHSAKLSSVLSK